MYVVLLAGGIASGKSTVARMLVAKGAHLVDLDVLSREVTETGSATNELIAKAFGNDVLDVNGALCRDVLARRAFATSEDTRRLEAIVHPAIRKRLDDWLAVQDAESVCVVEIPLLDRVEDLIGRADEVLCVVCPINDRRARAVRRGMDAADFDARVAQQTTDEYLVEHATTVLNNGAGEDELKEQIDDWWLRRSMAHREFCLATTQNS